MSPEAWLVIGAEARRPFSDQAEAIAYARGWGIVKPLYLVEPSSSIDHQQHRGIAWGIIEQALMAYHNFMLDDYFEPYGALHNIMGKMRERYDDYHYGLSTDFAWLIERDGPLYWTAPSAMLDERDGWSPDHLRAIRFARKEDAERVAKYFTRHDDCRAVEHGWSAAPSAISSSPLPPEHHLSPDEQKVMHKALRASAALASLPVPVGEPKPLCWVSGYDVAYLKDRIDGLRMRAYLEPNELRVPLYTASEGMVDLLRRVQPTIRNLAESARAKGSHPSTNGIFALADEIDAALSGKGAAPSVSPTQSTTEKLGMFGHHPDPAIDFEVEVQAIEGMAAEARAGMEPPFASAGQVRERLAKAMSFRVGGDQGAVAAKALLRKIDDEFRF
jgi:hypothetical protein